ncbi:fungal specific transcription factor [Beauveria bassiana ARSEF 2860]|uniref:Fungal specific transcription factor n=1 Tax=Beauveria bassiana (strain ARSEF 2860) TaxID=655819 RepID=J4KQN5_BEAB2|nr:fungal specific transcription factor [Beauveria bassiana ARSEF 2860]EJP69514.1 fungal specific transcription factor [Beauveria bassiana ARSEF 2860]
MPPLTYLQKTNGFIATQQPSTPGIIASSVGVVHIVRKTSPHVYDVATADYYLRELERKAKALDKNTRNQATASTSLETDVAISNGNDDDEDDFEDAEPLFESFTHLRLNRPSTSFQGPASSDTFLRNVGKVTGLGDEHDHLDIDPNLGEPVTLPSKKRVFTPHLRLPPLQVARRLFAAQYSFIGPIFAFTESKDEFEKSLFKAYVGLPDEGSREDCLHYAKLLLILAFGQMYSVNQWVDCRGPPGFAYFSEALSLLPETHEDGSLLCVEILALAGYFLQNTNKRDAAFQFIGRALRMAISLGLHHEVEGISASSSFTPQEVLAEDAAKEHRRRTWWSVYSLDRILSVKSGNPITIQDEDIGVWLPSRLHSEPEYCPAIVLRQYTKLSRILGEIHKKIYHRTNKNQTKSGKTLMASVQKILIDLSNWESELPSGLRFDPDRLVIGRESVSTLAHYYQCINMTIRPLLFHVVKKRLALIQKIPEALVKETDWKTGLSQTTTLSASTPLQMPTSLHADLGTATYGYMDGEHIFSATIVLVMVCAAFPASSVNMSAMNTGLGLLCSMSERGNTHIGARYEVLIRLLSTVMPSGYSVPLGSMPRSPALFLAPPADPSTLLAAAPLGESESTMSDMNTYPARFPVIDMQTLSEPFYDEGSTAGMDFGLWEEGFAYPTMDLDLDLAGQQLPVDLTGDGDYGQQTASTQRPQ